MGLVRDLLRFPENKIISPQEAIGVLTALPAETRIQGKYYPEGSWESKYFFGGGDISLVLPDGCLWAGILGIPISSIEEIKENPSRIASFIDDRFIKKTSHLGSVEGDKTKGDYQRYGVDDERGSIYLKLVGDGKGMVEGPVRRKIRLNW